MRHNDNLFINDLINPEVLKELIKQHPGTVFKQMHAMAPLEQYTNFLDLCCKMVAFKNKGNIEMKPPADPNTPETLSQPSNPSKTVIQGPSSIAFDSTLEETPTSHLQHLRPMLAWPFSTTTLWSSSLPSLLLFLVLFNRASLFHTLYCCLK